ncbi:NADH-ubiquinone oxidoreductase-F iron-sulfur binding region domain-containing protein [Mycobacterium sp. WMMD1722]|uniref:NADH-ubiquinone oxidoreductase-F iron-sulfur binding region domain-containing protein n=1 Tax=Mycobacterium sp. WMMD1722 TaxID=3404117 RepID=UPI003BF4825B
MKTTAAPVELTVAVWPGIEGRLLRPDLHTGTEGITDYLAGGGYQELPDPDALLEQIDLAGLTGRGGAAFPMAVKLRTVRDNGVRTGGAFIVANGEEGEPASVKDRWLLRHRPHLVLDGLRLAGRIVGADRAYLYISDQRAAQTASDALRETTGRFDGPPVTVVVVDPGYVAGEESAAVRVINGGPAKPTDKPPRTFEHGVAALPTAVSNVETLAHLPYLLRHGAQTYRRVGTSTSPGTFLATVTGGGRPAALYELPYGTSFPELLDRYGISRENLRGVLMGGYFAGLMNSEVLDTTLDHETMRRLGSGLGCGAIALITDECPIAVAAAVMAYFDRENAGQCGSCFNGTAAMAAVTGALRDGAATAEDLTRLERWSVILRGRGACATLDAATNVAATLLRSFPQEVARHLENTCSACASSVYSASRPYEVEAVMAP